MIKETRGETVRFKATEQESCNSEIWTGPSDDRSGVIASDVSCLHIDKGLTALWRKFGEVALGAHRFDAKRVLIDTFRGGMTSLPYICVCEIYMCVCMCVYIYIYIYIYIYGLGVACWPLVPKFAGSNPAEAFGFLGRKNPQHAFLRRGSKAVVDLRHVKDP